MRPERAHEVSRRGEEELEARAAPRAGYAAEPLGAEAERAARCESADVPAFAGRAGRALRRIARRGRPAPRTRPRRRARRARSSPTATRLRLHRPRASARATPGGG